MKGSEEDKQIVLFAGEETFDLGKEQNAIYGRERSSISVRKLR